MSQYNKIGNKVLKDFISQAHKQGLTVSEMHPETGQISLKNAHGQTILVSLVNLVDYYYRSRDKNAVRDFVAKVVNTMIAQDIPLWEEVKNSVYVSLYPTETKIEPFLAKNITESCCRFFIIDSPEHRLWITQNIFEAWNISQSVLEQQALTNGDSLLAKTELDIEFVQGRPFGSFQLEDRTLNAALLLAPSLKEKVKQSFGWPLYAIIPTKTACYFFRQEDFDFFETDIANIIIGEYENPQLIATELLELSDTGIRSVCGWVKKMGFLIRFDNNEPPYPN